MNHVTIYTTPTCGYCVLAKEYFKKHGVAYEEKDVAADTVAREEMVSKTHQLGVPVILVGNQILVGFSEAKLGEMLGIGM